MPRTRLMALFVALLFAGSGVIAGCGEDGPEENEETTNDGNDTSNDGNDTNDGSNGDDGSPGEASLDFDSGTSITDLSDDDVDQLCDGEVQYTPDYLSNDEWNQLNCIYQMSQEATANDADDPVQYCEDNFDTCLDEGPEFDLTEEASECKFTDMDLSQCDITIGEFEACLDEQNEGLRSFAQDVQCSDIEGGLGDTGGDGELGDACQTVQDNCPAYYEE